MSKNNQLTVLSSTRGIIETNFEEVKAYVTEAMKTCETVAVDQENLKERKQLVKMYSASENEIEKIRKEQKKEFLLPLTKFEDECKELKAIIANGKKFIKDQTDRFDEEERQKKRDIFTKEADRLCQDSICSAKFINRITMPDWVTNVATSKKKILDNVSEQVDVITNAYNTEQSNIMMVEEQVVTVSELVGLATPLTVDDVTRYISDYETMDVQQVMANINVEAKKRKQAEEAAITAAEAKRIAEEERQRKAKEEAERQAKLAEERRIAEEAILKEQEEREVAEAKKIAEIEGSKIEELEAFVADIDDFFKKPIEEVKAIEKPTKYTHTIETTLSSMEVYNLFAKNGIDVVVKGE